MAPSSSRNITSARHCTTPLAPPPPPPVFPGPPDGSMTASLSVCPCVSPAVSPFLLLLLPLASAAAVVERRGREREKQHSKRLWRIRIQIVPRLKLALSATTSFFWAARSLSLAPLSPSPLSSATTHHGILRRGASRIGRVARASARSRADCACGCGVEYACRWRRGVGGDGGRDRGDDRDGCGCARAPVLSALVCSPASTVVARSRCCRHPRYRAKAAYRIVSVGRA